MTDQLSNFIPASFIIQVLNKFQVNILLFWILKAQVTNKNMSKIINDSIHGHVVVPEIVVKIIDTPQFQRLRRVKQTGASHYIYPDATHTRFSHSIGVCHLARLMGETLQKSNSDITSKVLAIFSKFCSSRER